MISSDLYCWYSKQNTGKIYITLANLATAKTTTIAAATCIGILSAKSREEAKKNEWVNYVAEIVKEIVNWNPLHFESMVYMVLRISDNLTGEKWNGREKKYAVHPEWVCVCVECSQCSNHFKHSKSSIATHTHPLCFSLSLSLTGGMCMTHKSQNILSFWSHVDTL